MRNTWPILLASSSILNRRTRAGALLLTEDMGVPEWMRKVIFSLMFDQSR